MSGPAGSCPRCRTSGAEVLRGTDAWELRHCPVCSFTWRTTEPGTVVRADLRPADFQLDPDAIGQLRQVLPIPPAARTGRPRGAHLVGSIPLSDAEEVFRLAAGQLGAHLERIPDGETGDRANWIRWQRAVFANSPAFVPVVREKDYGGPDEYELAPGVRVEAGTIGTLGYARTARASYAVFARLKAEGIVPAATRFQVSLPTPVAVVAGFVAPADRAAVEAPYRDAMLAELAAVVAAIPAYELAVQWDVAVEFALLESNGRAFGDWWGPTDPPLIEQLVPRLIELGAQVPDGVQLGYHLCYGDAGHKHFVEPVDTGLLVRVANSVANGLPRALDWLHLPVPIDRDDAAYFAPLAGLDLPDATRVHLGLVHLGDGADGGRRRIAAARRALADFGIATECGLGRRPPGTVPELLRLHRTLLTS